MRYSSGSQVALMRRNTSVLRLRKCSSKGNGCLATRWLKYIFLLTLSTAVQCLASEPVQLSASPNWGGNNRYLLQDRPAMQLYQPGARNRKRMSSTGKGYDCIPVGHSPESGTEHCYEVVALATGLEKGFEKSKDEQ